jgi:YkoY family integral membrane protein
MQPISLPFDQTFAPPDLAVIALLIVLEGVLSIDNALVLGLLAKRLPKELQGKALTYGLVGAFVFRIITIGAATFLLKWTVFKFLGGAYLLYTALHHFYQQWRGEGDDADLAGGSRKPRFAGFWPTVLVIELTDIAFAIDSILAAIALVGPPPKGAPLSDFHPKLWVVVTGGMLGVVLMRFAAILFIKLLDRFPRFEMAAYLLVLVIGVKLLADYVGNDLLAAPGTHPVDFHSYHNPWFWGFWAAMVLAFLTGFLPGSGSPAASVDRLERTPEA